MGKVLDIKDINDYNNLVYNLNYPDLWTNLLLVFNCLDDRKDFEDLLGKLLALDFWDTDDDLFEFVEFKVFKFLVDLRDDELRFKEDLEEDKYVLVSNLNEICGFNVNLPGGIECDCNYKGDVN